MVYRLVHNDVHNNQGLHQDLTEKRDQLTKWTK